MSPVPLLQLDVNLTAQCGKAIIKLTSSNNEIYVNLTSFDGVFDLLRTLPDPSVLKPLLAGSELVGLADTICHLQLKKNTLLSFKLANAPLNLKDVLTQSITRFLP